MRRERLERRRLVGAVAVAGLVVALLAPGSARAHHSSSQLVIFDFESDGLRQAPSDVSVTAGKMEVTFDPVLGKALHPVEAGPTHTVPRNVNLAAGTFDGVVGRDMTVTWREASWLGGDRHAMTLRATGKVSGYIFAISNVVAHTGRDVHHNQVAIYRSTLDNEIVELASAPLIGRPLRHFRAGAVDRVTASGATVTDLTLSYSDDGGTTFVPVAWATDAAPLPAGGLQYTGGWEGTNPALTMVDDVTVTFTPETALTITSPADFRVFQRDATNQATIEITGTYRVPDGHALPTAIEARWDGSPWEIVDASPAGGTFSGSLPNRSVGQGTLEVRFANDAAVTASRRYVGIGDVFVVAGQSNAVGFGWEGQTYRAPATAPDLRAGMYSYELQWKELADPVGGGGGSVWPLVATELLADQQVPVAFVATAVGGTSITQWQKGQWKYYGSMSDRINSLGGRNAVKAVLFWQGETDAMNGMSRSTYRTLLESFADSVWNDFGVEVMAAQIGEVGIDGNLIDPVRQAQQDAWNAGGHVLPGPALYDVDLSDDTFNGKTEDGTHFVATEDLQTAAERWWAAIKDAFYGGTDGRGPLLVSAVRDVTGTEVTVTFSDATLPLEPSAGIDGFLVEDAGAKIDVVSASRVLDDTLVLNLSAPVTASATLSLGTGHASAGKVVPTDSTAFLLPAETFVDVPIGP